MVAGANTLSCYVLTHCARGAGIRDGPAEQSHGEQAGQDQSKEERTVRALLDGPHSVDERVDSCVWVVVVCCVLSRRR